MVYVLRSACFHVLDLGDRSTSVRIDPSYVSKVYTLFYGVAALFI